MRPLSVTVHDSNSPYFDDETTYDFDTFEKLTSAVATDFSCEDIRCHITVHCTQDIGLELNFYLDYGRIMSFQCFCAEYIHRCEYKMSSSELDEAYDTLQTIQSITWPVH